MNESPLALLEIRNLKKSFQIKGQIFAALHSFSLSLDKGESVALVGESGSGKSTAGKTILRLQEPDSGSVTYGGVDLLSLSSAQMKQMRRKMQIIFQDPYSALNPRMTILDSVGEGFDIHTHVRGKERQRKVQLLLQSVDLNATDIHRFPHEFSGGQRQRIAIARALALEPEFMVCDEPLSALDAPTQKHILRLLTDLQQAKGMALLFITHDLSTARKISQRIAVMYRGTLVEVGPTEQVYTFPKHPYTQLLINSIPTPDPRKERARSPFLNIGEPAQPLNVLQGCAFYARCPYAMPICQTKAPSLKQIAPRHTVACHLLDKD